MLEELGERGVMHHQYQVTGGPKSRTQRLPRTRTSHPHKGRHPTAARVNTRAQLRKLTAASQSSGSWLVEQYSRTLRPGLDSLQERVRLTGSCMDKSASNVHQKLSGTVEVQKVPKGVSKKETS